MREATLCYLIQESKPRQILLGLKKLGFGAGKVVGFGGGVEKGESIAEATLRELYEETQVKAALTDLQYVAHLTFVFPGRPAWNHVVYTSLVTGWEGEAVESNEIVPSWYAVDAIPYARMWSDSAYWLPHVLAGECIRAWFTFQPDNDTVKEAHLTSLEDGEAGAAAISRFWQASACRG